MARYALATAPGVASALAVVALEGTEAADLDRALLAVTGSCPAPGEVKLRDLGGADTGLVLRWSATRADLTPHGGPAVLRRLVAAFEAAGIGRTGSASRPEARSRGESLWLDALARCPSPRGLELLLRQPALHANWPEIELSEPSQRDLRLARLIDPPLVAVVGPTNIGKSTLLNALARRRVAVAADVPGVTRDAVGALVELDGLVVRWLDTPGVTDSTGADRRAAELARGLVARADLVLSASDATAGPVGEGVGVGLRVDLGPALGECELSVSALDPGSVAGFAAAVRGLLVPDGDAEEDRPWAFWAPGPLASAPA